MWGVKFAGFLLRIPDWVTFVLGTVVCAAMFALIGFLKFGDIGHTVAGALAGVAGVPIGWTIYRRQQANR
jgi:hypothetical protein